MKKFMAPLVFLLFVSLISNNAKAEDTNSFLAANEKKHRKTDRIVQVLHAAGATHPMVAQTVEYIDENIHGDHFYFTKKRYEDEDIKLNIGLRHELATPKLKRIELHFQEDGSNYSYTASGEAVMVRYKAKFSW